MLLPFVVLLVLSSESAGFTFGDENGNGERDLLIEREENDGPDEGEDLHVRKFSLQPEEELESRALNDDEDDENDDKFYVRGVGENLNKPNSVLAPEKRVLGRLMWHGARHAARLLRGRRRHRSKPRPQIHYHRHYYCG